MGNYVTEERIQSDFGYHQPSNDRVKANHEDVRALLRDAARRIVEHTPSGREQSLALTKLEEAMFWANAAIARNQYDSRYPLGE